MRNLSLRIAAVAAALALAAPAAATNGMRVIGFGAVQTSMGGAAAALPLDASTIVSNPAGMTALDRRLDVYGSAYFPTVKYSADWTDPGSGFGFSGSESSDRPPDFIPTIATVYKTSENLTVGVAALGIAGLGVDYPQSFDPGNGTGSLFASSLLTSYMNMRVAPAVAYRLSDRLSVGLAANLMYAQMKYSAMDAAGMPPRDTAGSFGYGATVGLTYRAPEKYTLAAVYETQSWFQDFSFDVPDGTEKMKFNQPDVATIGASFQPMEALLVAGDFQWIRWSTTNGKGAPELTQTVPSSVPGGFNMDWSDQIVFKLGAQYTVTKELSLRAGYNYGSSVLNKDQAFENIAFPATVKHHFTVGGGYAFGGLSVNASVMYAPEEKISGSNPAQYIDAYQTSVSQLAFDLGVAWKY